MMSFFAVFYFVVPALSLVHLIFKEEATRWDAVAGFGLAILVVGWAGYGISLVTLQPYSHLTLLLINAVFLLIVQREWRDIVRRLRDWVRQGPPSLEAAVVFGLVSACFLLSLLFFRTDGYCTTCLHFSLSRAIGLPIGDPVLQQDFFISRSLLFLDWHEREGVYATLAPFARLWGFFGLRLFFAVTNSLNGVFGYLIAKRCLTGGALPRILVAVLFMAFPFGIDLFWNDINTVSFFAASAVLYLASGRKLNLRAIAVFFCLLLAVRHIALLSIGGPLSLLIDRRSRKRVAWRKVVRPFLVTLFVAGLPLLIHHTVAFRFPFAFESLYDTGWHQHSIFGSIPISLPGMLNFPFHHIVRTPFNALPLFMLYPVWAVSRLGLILASLFVIGMIGYLRKNKWGWRKNPILWAILPYVLFLGINENFLQIEKMGFIAPVVPLFFLAVGHGVVVLGRLRRPIVRLAVWGATMAQIYLAAQLFLRVEVPPDERFYQQYYFLLRERPEYLNAERELLRVRLAPSPEWRRLSLVKNPFADLWKTIKAPEYRQRRISPMEEIIQELIPVTYNFLFKQQEIAPCKPPPPVSPSEGIRRLTVDLSRPWVAGRDWIQEEENLERDQNLVFDLVNAKDVLRYANFPMPWEPERSTNLLAFRHGKIVYVVLCGLHDKTLRLEDDGPTFTIETEIESAALRDGRFGLIVPRDSTIRFLEFVTIDPSRHYIWQLPSGVDLEGLEGPVHWRHS